MDTIFFDLDGTLTDPKPGITRSIQYALRKLDRPVPSEDDLTWCIGPPLRASFVTLLGGEEFADRGVELYRERFADTGLYENAVYPGIEATLSALQATGLTLFVATSKPRVFAERIIDHFALRGYFTRVFGSELDGTRVDKGHLLAYALAETGVDPARAVMIGDRSHDVVGAAKNGLRAIGVTYGYGSASELTGAGAASLCASPEDVLDRVMGWR
ncbi:HAD family hydrolase [Bradyrhizobium sp. U87765 SZCCT0131]|uniref:HAD family hydrolase n=1 Tax=unclassified Bradyrhizobium TaxID=2631580 RepID=UPI001BA5FFB9|nr:MULTISPECIES: HAD family hydrolase [unclassified Bradyrhizobium]MBR1217914.1 HAD family hydrolase [Bradyrhizobium sp. U87765 SZCCT0131]MBR1261140.1 HAD family hydrolase [Bradyrhizobium sp. U87765 SZCCT0134]MBR1303412.1 HAD family hydrolase [Bradyrhizobium sp. U87765 SZCCT0110]MBR1319018.1 HAD family hydrolase [Bradyrhizobium sp. U87765 SZCCT0109]MBR1347343.1 HAD family hydrolase [Bradyrhizobium sp. U87765 SZCCT0048]